MPYNKDAYSRYKLIDTTLRRKQKSFPSLDEIVAYISNKLGKPVSARTIQQDIYDMRYDSNLGFDAPIEYHRGKRGYYYTDPEYFMERLPVTEDELQSLEMCIGFLQQYTSIPAIKQFEESIKRLAASVQKSKEQSTTHPLMAVDHNKRYQGAEWMPAITEGIRERKMIKLDYHPFNKEKPKTHTIHPYFIKEYNNRLYLIANDVAPGKMEKFLTFSFDRITNVIVHETKFKERFIDAHNYFNNALGVTSVDDSPEKIEIRVSKSIKQYILTQPIHRSQELIKEKGDEIYISLNIVINIELIMMILSYGAEMKVLSPQRLVDTIANKGKEIVNLYGG
jgi:predicted DNA-binding transcriptional regulator YafY